MPILWHEQLQRHGHIYLIGPGWVWLWRILPRYLWGISQTPLSKKKKLNRFLQPNVNVRYCWWLKSCTTCYLWNPIKRLIFSISTGEGYLPSTVGTWDLFLSGYVACGSQNLLVDFVSFYFAQMSCVNWHTPKKSNIPSRELTYLTLGKGKNIFKSDLEGDMLVSRRVDTNNCHV